MTRPDLTELLKRAGERLPVGPPPIPDMLATAHRTRRRRTMLLTTGTSAAVVVLVAGTALLSTPSSDLAPNPVPAQSATSSPASESPPTVASSAPGHTPSKSAAPVLTPDLVGLPSAEAARRLDRIDASAYWARPFIVRCEMRPGTVARQQPAPGTPLEPGADVEIRTAALGLDAFRGPCEPAGGDLGPSTGADAALARQFYRFSADPSLGAPFAAGEELWVGIENGPTSTSLGKAELADLAAWEMGEEYAERTGPFSALDTLARSGGYYELHDGIAATCASGNDEAPPQFAGLRAISLTAPSDTTLACLDWWGVTLFLDSRGHIAGVALRLGAP
jgi:hypothetical protein